MKIDKFGLWPLATMLLAVALIIWGGLYGPIATIVIGASFDGWLAFFGNVLGAVATVGAAGWAWYSIRHQQRLDFLLREEQRLDFEMDGLAQANNLLRAIIPVERAPDNFQEEIRKAGLTTPDGSVSRGLVMAAIPQTPEPYRLSIINCIEGLANNHKALNKVPVLYPDITTPPLRIRNDSDLRDALWQAIEALSKRLRQIDIDVRKRQNAIWEERAANRKEIARLAR